MRIVSTILVLAGLLPLASAHAAPGEPVAVRWWGQAMVSLETFNGLDVVCDPYGLKIGYDDPQLAADLVLITHNHFDHNNPEIVRGEPIVARGLDDSDQYVGMQQVLDRFPTESKPRWISGKLRIAHSPHAIRVTSIASWHDNAQGAERGANAMLLVEVDGVRIVHCGDIGQLQFTDEQLRAMGKVDVLLLPVGGTYTVDGPQAAALVAQVNPRFVVPLHYKTSALKLDLAGVEPFLAAVESSCEIVRPVGNTLAVSAAREVLAAAKPRVVVLDYRPWEMPVELAEMFARKEAASAAAAAVLAPLSVEQMNFRPANGTHTPRWNAEHMLGRELGFFSEIYAQRDGEIAKLERESGPDAPRIRGSPSRLDRGPRGPGDRAGRGIFAAICVFAG